eukprot:jgi/Chlat1/551/Chrsp103S01125
MAAARTSAGLAARALAFRQAACLGAGGVELATLSSSKLTPISWAVAHADNSWHSWQAAACAPAASLKSNCQIAPSSLPTPWQHLQGLSLHNTVVVPADGLTATPTLHMPTLASTLAEPLLLSSVKRKRRQKMNKHKHRKRRRRDRFRNK